MNAAWRPTTLRSGSCEEITPSGNSGIDASAFVFVSQSDQSSSSLENAVVDSSLPSLQLVDRAQMCWHIVNVECLIEEDHRPGPFGS